MGNDDWFRNSRWDAETEALFNEKLARSRSQKAQYLRIQGSLLKNSVPAAAICLLQRCIDEGDESYIAHAHFEIAHARYVQGDVDAALVSLEAAIEQQKRQPMFRTSAVHDYAFLVALHGIVHRYDRALDWLDGEIDGLFASMTFESESAKALIFHSRQQAAQAQQAAQNALAAAAVSVSWIPGHPDVGVVPQIESPLHDRLRGIAKLPPIE